MGSHRIWIGRTGILPFRAGRVSRSRRTGVGIAFRLWGVRRPPSITVTPSFIGPSFLAARGSSAFLMSRKFGLIRPGLALSEPVLDNADPGLSGIGDLT